MIEKSRKADSSFLGPSPQSSAVVAQQVEVVPRPPLDSYTPTTNFSVTPSQVATDLALLKDREEQREKLRRERLENFRFWMNVFISTATLVVAAISMLMLYRANYWAAMRALLEQSPSGRPRESVQYVPFPPIAPTTPAAPALPEPPKTGSETPHETRLTRYVVKANDNLCRIGGSTEAANAIIELNHLPVLESHGVRWARIYPGQVLLLPSAFTKPSAVYVTCGQLL